VARKALIVRFKNAQIFFDPRRSSDKMISGKNKVPRNKAPRINVSEGSLDRRHVSNLLHVLAGERPVPTLRESCMKRDEAIFDMASKAMVRVNETTTRETKTVRKAVKDSWNTVTLFYHLNGKDIKVKGGLIYHARLRRYLGESLYNLFLQTLQDISGCKDPQLDFSAQEAIEYLNSHSQYDKRVIKLITECKKQGRATIANFLEPDGNVASITIHQGSGCKLNTLVVNAGIEKIRSLTGTIYVPIESDEALQRFRKAGGVATFLEGGFAYIAGTAEWSEDLVDGCQPVVEGEMVHVPDRA